MNEKSSTGLDANIAAGLAVLFFWLGGLIFFLIEKQSGFVKFYAIQSIMINLLLVVLGTIAFVIGALLFKLVSFAIMVVWVITLINALQGKMWELPLLGKTARKMAGI